MEGKENKKNNFSWPVVVMVVLLAVVGYCSYKLGEVGRDVVDDSNLEKGGNTSVSGESETNQANPWTYVDTLDDVEKTLGFTIKVPEKVNGLTMSETIGVLKNLKMVEVQYVNDTDEDKKIVVRKALASAVAKEENFSGVYDTYESTKDVDNVSLSSNDKTVYLAEWKDTRYHYSVYAIDGMTQETILKLVKEIK